MDNALSELSDLKKRIHAQIAHCQHKQATTQDDKWHLQEIALLQSLATINQTEVLEHGFQGLHAVLKVKAADVINEQIKGLFSEDPGGS